MADGIKTAIKDTGTIMKGVVLPKGKDGDIKNKDAMFVPIVSKNLLSVPLNDKGEKFQVCLMIPRITWSTAQHKLWQ